MLILNNIEKYYNPATVNQHCVFNKFNLEVEGGQFLNIVGSNGSGKTTLLNIICASTDIDGGSIIFDGRDISQDKDFIRFGQIGRVYQDPSLGTAPSMTLLENLAMADNKGNSWDLKRAVKKDDIYRYQSMLKELGLNLENKLDEKVASFSGGQRQAISLLMATMTPIKLLVLDEHTAALDPKTADKIMDITERIVIEKNLTVLMVTHNLRYALEYGDRLIMMHEGQIILDEKGREKEKISLANLLEKFNQISIELGN